MIPLLRAIVASVAVLGLSLAAHAQAEPEKPAPPAQKKPAAKARKVWTNEDVGSLRTQADDYLEAKQAQDEAAARQEAASQQQRGSAKSAGAAAQPPLLSNPKTVEDADKMIAWEQRDIEGQQEFVLRLQNQVAEAPESDKPRLQKLLDERTKLLAETRKEQEALKAQRKALEKKPAPSQTTNPPAQ